MVCLVFDEMVTLVIVNCCSMRRVWQVLLVLFVHLSNSTELLSIAGSGTSSGPIDLELGSARSGW